MAKAPVTDIGGSVMLAEKWTVDTDPTGWWMSEKLDGVRGFWTGSGMYSRNGKEFSIPTWLYNLLPPNVEMDGELYGGPGMFSHSVSIVKSGTADPARWKSLRYMVFDVPLIGAAPFEHRIGAMRQLESAIGSKHVVAVAQTQCRSPKHLGDFHKEVVSRGIEGTMLRAPGSQYERRRSRSLLKVKDFHDDEARIIGYVPGEGRHKGRLGAYECQLANGVRFRVGSGMSDQERDRPLKIGTVITVRYQELIAESGVPRFPTYVGPRAD